MQNASSASSVDDAFIYALKEIRACLEAEILTDVQQRLALLSLDMENHNRRRLHPPTFSRS